MQSSCYKKQFKK